MSICENQRDCVRHHEEIEKLRTDLETATAACVDYCGVIEQLTRQRDMLVNALEHVSLCGINSMSSRHEMMRVAQKAINSVK